MDAINMLCGSLDRLACKWLDLRTERAARNNPAIGDFNLK